MEEIKKQQNIFIIFILFNSLKILEKRKFNEKGK